MFVFWRGNVLSGQEWLIASVLSGLQDEDNMRWVRGGVCVRGGEEGLNTTFRQTTREKQNIVTYTSALTFCVFHVFLLSILSIGFFIFFFFSNSFSFSFSFFLLFFFLFSFFFYFSFFFSNSFSFYFGFWENLRIKPSSSLCVKMRLVEPYRQCQTCSARGNFWHSVLAGRRCHHFIRNVPPEDSAAYAQGRDRSTRVVDLVGKGLPGDLHQRHEAERLATLPKRMGGSACRKAPGAYWASWADALPTFQDRPPAIAQSVSDQLEFEETMGCVGSLQHAAEAQDRSGFVGRPSWEQLRAGVRPPPDTVAEPGDWQHGWQYCASPLPGGRSFLPSLTLDLEPAQFCAERPPDRSSSCSLGCSELLWRWHQRGSQRGFVARRGPWCEPT